MPIYQYTCPACDYSKEGFRRLKDRLNGPVCEKCGYRMIFTLSFSKRKGPSYPYVDPYMDRKPVEITSRAHRLRELKKRGLQETGVRRGMKGQWI